MSQNSMIDEVNEDAKASSRMLGVVLFAVGFVCLACLLAAGLILSAKGML